VLQSLDDHELKQQQQYLDFQEEQPRPMVQVVRFERCSLVSKESSWYQKNPWKVPCNFCNGWAEEIVIIEPPCDDWLLLLLPQGLTRVSGLKRVALIHVPWNADLGLGLHDLMCFPNIHIQELNLPSQAQQKQQHQQQQQQ
jgi:hypothetical protein